MLINSKNQMALSKINKSTFMLVFILISNFVSFGQTNINEINKINLPPGSQMPLKFEFIDYSYKLDNISSGDVKLTEDKNFLQEFSDADLLDMKTTSSSRYQYYIKANEFYKNLSNKVKAVFSVKELWYVYMFDLNLTSKLMTIK